MHRPFRRLSLILWLGMHTAITLCSPALHELTGGRHGGPGAVASGRADAGLGMHGDSSTPTASAAVAGADDEGHCPVCSYLAQAQVAPTTATAPSAGCIVIAREDRSSIGPRSVPLLPSQPRAPPRSALAHA